MVTGNSAVSSAEEKQTLFCKPLNPWSPGTHHFLKRAAIRTGSVLKNQQIHGAPNYPFLKPVLKLGAGKAATCPVYLT